MARLLDNWEATLRPDRRPHGLVAYWKPELTGTDTSSPKSKDRHRSLSPGTATAPGQVRGAGRGRVARSGCSPPRTGSVAAGGALHL